MARIATPIQRESGSATPSSYQSAMYSPTCAPPITATMSVADIQATDTSARFTVAMHSGRSSSRSPLPVHSLQLTARFTSSLMRPSSAAPSSFNAYDVGHMAPSSRLALSLKPSVA